MSCPMLEYIYLWHCFPYDLSVKYLSGITEAHFRMKPHDNNYARKLLNIVRGLTSIKYLSLSDPIMKVMESLLHL